MTPPAPHLTTENTCSECRVRPMPSPAGKVCPNCYALLWHEDHSAAEQARKDELRARHTAAERERRQLRDLHRREQAERREQARLQMFEQITLPKS